VARGGSGLKILVTGSRGQLGRALEAACAGRGLGFVGLDLPECDITDAAAVDRAVAAARPTAIVNCAAFTAVDAAEAREAEALAVNGAAVATLAEAADRAGVTLVQLSTDYVFDGATTRPYREDDPPAPRSAYGRTKLAGEAAAAGAARHLIVRTAWLFGTGGANFVDAIRRQLTGGAGALRVVDDQTGSPTYAADLAGALLDLIALGVSGTVHAVNGGQATWCDLARAIVGRLGANVEVVPITTAEAARPAPRPAFSVLDAGKLAALLGRRLPDWRDALARYLAVVS
jgi:dTDP-4-dehydrorhamnose reductase